MLILKRNKEDVVDIYVQDAYNKTEIQISLKVLGLDGRSVRLGFDAPENVLILRREVPRRPQKED